MTLQKSIRPCIHFDYIRHNLMNNVSCGPATMYELSARLGKFPNEGKVADACIPIYTTLTDFSMKCHLMCKVYTDVGGIK